MKKLLATILASLVGTWAIGQSITPDPKTGNGICPDEDRTFTIINIPTGCTSYTLTREEGELNAPIGTNGNTFTINAVNKSQTIKIKFVGGSCTQDFYIPVISVKDKTPTLSGCPSPRIVGRTHTFTLTATLNYQHRGNGDPFEAETYTWALPSGSGWTFTTSNGSSNGTTITAKTATFTTDLCSSETITVFATDHCGNTSLAATCAVNRIVEKPNITGGPSFVVCEDVAPISLSAVQPTSGLNGYTYNWYYDTWSGTSSGSTATVIPNGTTAGNIRVTAQSCGLLAPAATLTIPLQVIHPDREVQGPTVICPGISKEFFLEQPLPPSSATTWQSTPLNLTIPPSGTGTTAQVEAAPNIQGFGKMVFTVNNVCGTASRFYDIYVGNPAAGEVLINGLPGPFNWLCPNDQYNIAYYSPTVGNPLAEEHYEWIADGCLTILWGQGTPSITVATPPIGGDVFFETYYGILTLVVSNECGETVTEVPYTIKDCGGLGNPARPGLVVDPNPAVTGVQVRILDPVSGQPVSDGKVNTLRILNQFGNLMETRMTADPIVPFDVSAWPSGTYFVHLARLGTTNSKFFQITRP